MRDPLDHDEYYNDDEQAAYEHGLGEGYRVGCIVSILLLVLILGTYLLITKIL